MMRRLFPWLYEPEPNRHVWCAWPAFAMLAKASQANTRPGDLVPMLEAAARDLRAMGCILAAELVHDAIGEIENVGGDL